MSAAIGYSGNLAGHRYVPWLVIVLCLLPFLPGASGPFQLDDAANLARLHLRELSPEAVYEALFNNPSGVLRRPLSNATLLLQAQLGAESPLSYKAVNLLLHGFNGWLVWLLSARLLEFLLPRESNSRRQTIALLAGAVWTLHPLQVSSVLYVVQRMTLLSSSFMLLSLLLALRPMGVPGALPNRADGWRHAVLVGLLALVAVLFKENGALVPIMLLALVLALPREQYALATDSVGKRGFVGLAIWLPCLLTAVIASAAWPWLSAAYAGRAFTLSERLITEARVLGDYLVTFVLPLPERMGLYLDDVTVVSTATPGWYVAPLLALGVLGAAFAVRRGYPLFAFAVFWFGACHLMESTFIPLELKFEHRNYLALLGPALLAVSGISQLAQAVSERIAIILAIALLLLLASMTLIRSTDWSDEERFIITELRHHPRSVRANMEMARLESISGHNDAAFRRILASQKMMPDAYAPLASNLELGCAGYPVRWDRLLEFMRSRPSDASIQNQALYETLLGQLGRGACVPGFGDSMNAHVDMAIAIYTKNGNRRGLQFFLMIKAQMQPTPELMREWLRRAVNADPGEMGPLIRLAYLDMSLGDTAGVHKALDQLRRLVPRWHPDRLFVKELEREVAAPRKL